MIALRTLLFTILVPGTVTVVIPALLLGANLAMSDIELAAARWIGLAPLGAGIAIYVWCALDFTVAGRGTPGPWDAPKELVVRGLYRWTRNPMYIGVLLVLLGEAILFQATTLIVYAGLIGLAFYLFVVVYEEPALRSQFGDSYTRYCEAVPRWLPRLRGQK